MEHDDTGKERLQKILARAGFGSRRACEDLIVEGRATINNQTVSLLGVRADPFRDVIAVDGERIHLPKPAYWILNKSEGMSFNDKGSEESLQNLVQGDFGRLFTAGRLDRFARGLMLITNDGRVANLLTHPRYRVPKVYRISVKGAVEIPAVRNIERALYYAMNGGRFEPIYVGKRVAGKTHLQLTVYEGLPQALRDICLKFAHGVKTVERVRLGPIELGAAPAGGLRKLRPEEIKRLLEYADDAENGRLSYENPLIDPAKFKRDEAVTGFRRKKTGSQGTTTTGQKKTSARLKSDAAGKRLSSGKARSDRPDRTRGERSDRPKGDRANKSRGDRPDRPRGERNSSPRSDRPDRPRGERTSKPRGERTDRPRGGRSSTPRSDRPERPRGERTSKPRGERTERPRGERSSRPRGDRPGGERSGKPRGDRLGSDRPRSPRSGGPKSSGGGTRGPTRPGGKPRPGGTSSGKRGAPKRRPGK